MKRRTALLSLAALLPTPVIARWGRWGNNFNASCTLTQVEIDHLQYMREEEKLARDVYIVMGDTWGTRVHHNIAESEQRHTDAVRRQLTKYNVEDPVKDDTVGVFTNPDLQELYNSLVERGSTSKVESILVGGYIEEVDMIDINVAIVETSCPSIIRTYENLLAGSENHLRAFARVYKSLTGEDYVAQVLSQEEVDEILAS